MSGGWSYLSSVRGTQIGATVASSALSDGSDFSNITAVGLGELNAGLIAKQVQAKTGITTTADDIIMRSAASRIGGSRAGTDPMTQAKVALAKALTGNLSTGDSAAAGALISSLNPLYREFGQSDANRKLLAIMDAVGVTGADAALISAAAEITNLGRTVLASAASDIVARVTAILGDSQWMRDIVGVVGDIAANVTKFMPYIAAVVQSGVALAQWAMTQWGPIRGDSVPCGADPWVDFGPRLYARLARLDGLSAGTDGDWVGSYSPFLYENTTWNPNLLGVLADSVRCLDLHQYKLQGAGSHLPKWRDVLSGTSAIRYAKDNRDSLPLPPGMNAEKVYGCKWREDQSGHVPAALTPIRPYRWYQNQSGFRAATIASLFTNGTVCCIRGVGQWVASCRGLAGRTSDDHECYNDNSPWYAIGYPWRGKSWWATWGEYHGWGMQILMLPPSAVPEIPRDVVLRGTDAIRPWMVSALLSRRASWIPIADLRSGHPELPRAGTAGRVASSMIGKSARPNPRLFILPVGGDDHGSGSESGVPVVAVVGGVSVLALLAWLALR